MTELNKQTKRMMYTPDDSYLANLPYLEAVILLERAFIDTFPGITKCKERINELGVIDDRTK